MRKKLNEIFKSEFLKNFGFVFSGNGLALVIPFLIAPFLTRLYTPEDFAGYELFARVVALLAAIATLRYDLAIILPKDHSEAIKVVSLSFRILVWFTILSGLILIPFRFEIARLASNSELESYLIWAPLAIFFTSALFILTQYLVRENYFKTVAFNKITASSSGNIGKYLIGLRISGGLGLVLGQILGVAIPTLTMMKSKNLRQMIKAVWHQRLGLKEIAVKYRQFPLYNMPHSFYDEGVRFLLFAVVSIYYGELVMGLFALTFRYIRIPVQVFGSSLSQVLIPQVALEYAEGLSVVHRVQKAFALLFIIGVVPFGAILLFGPELFSFIFGKVWMVSGEYAAVMVPWLFSNFLISPVSMIPSIVGRQGTFFLINVIFSILAIGALSFMSVHEFDFISVLGTYAAVNTVLNIFLGIWFMLILKQKNKNSEV